MSSLGDVSEDEASRDEDENDGEGDSHPPVVDHSHVPTSNASDDGHSSADEDVREGRFYGPDSSWRFYTQEERTLAASLDQIECNDLSIHLYNTHAWKSQYRRDPPDGDIQPWRAKQDWIQPNDDATMPFVPAPDWTAWPLKPTDVPRSFERWGVVPIHPEEDLGTYRKSESWKPGSDLRDEVKAIFLRRAKERFNLRSWEQQRSSTNIDDVAYVKTEASSEASRRTSTSSQQLAHNESIKIEGSGDDIAKPTMETHPSSSNIVYEPLFLADDDEAGMLLQPSLHHTIAKLDDLLVGLHRSRQGQSRRSSSPHSRGRRSKSRSRSRAASSTNIHQKRKRQSFDGDADAAIVSDAEDKSPAISVSHDSRRNYTRRLGTRDWSEVLGVAALTGWDPAVLDRAAQRCAAIFKETISFRLMPEASAGQQRDSVREYLPETVPMVETASEVDSEQSEELSDQPDLLCPFETCTRHAVPFEYRWRLTEHLKRKHGQTDPELSSSAATKKHEDEEEAVEAVETRGESETDEDEESDNDGENGLGAVRQDGFLQPIHVPTGRSRDIRARSRQPRHNTTSEDQP